MIYGKTMDGEFQMMIRLVRGLTFTMPLAQTQDVITTEKHAWNTSATATTSLWCNKTKLNFIRQTKTKRLNILIKNKRHGDLVMVGTEDWKVCDVDMCAVLCLFSLLWINRWHILIENFLWFGKLKRENDFDAACNCNQYDETAP